MRASPLLNWAMSGIAVRQRGKGWDKGGGIGGTDSRKPTHLIYRNLIGRVECGSQWMRQRFFLWSSSHPPIPKAAVVRAHRIACVSDASCHARSPLRQ
jgi:hypothetical protein